MNQRSQQLALIYFDVSCSNARGPAIAGGMPFKAVESFMLGHRDEYPQVIHDSQKADCVASFDENGRWHLTPASAITPPRGERG